MIIKRLMTIKRNKYIYITHLNHPITILYSRQSNIISDDNWSRYISILYYRKKTKRVNTCDVLEEDSNEGNDDKQRQEGHHISKQIEQWIFSEIGEGKLKCVITNMKNSSSSIYIYSSHITSQNLNVALLDKIAGK